jgi:Protein of unknown function (DUF998)
MARGSRSRSTTKGLLICGFAAAALYIVGDLVSGFAYKSSRPYSFKDQWISELTATGSPVRPGMLTVITIHDLLLIAFGIGVWRAGADAQNRSLRWAGVVLIAAHAFGLLIHSFFPMTSRWLEPTSSDWMHGAASAVWGIGISVAILLAAVAIRGWFRWFSIASLVVIVGSSALSSVAFQGIEQNDTAWAGALERVSAYGLMVWLVVFAWITLRPYRAATEPSLGKRRERSGASWLKP